MNSNFKCLTVSQPFYEVVSIEEDCIASNVDIAHEMFLDQVIIVVTEVKVVVVFLLAILLYQFKTLFLISGIS